MTVEAFEQPDIILTREPVNTSGLTPAGSTDVRALQQWSAQFTINLRRILQQLQDGLTEAQALAQANGVPEAPQEPIVKEEDIDDLKRRIKAEADARELQSSALQNAINLLDVEIDGIERLTPQQIFEISLATRTEELLGGSGEAVASALEWSQRAAEEALNARIKGYENGASIRTTQRTLASESEALAQQITTVSAAITVAEGQITQTQADLATAQANLATAQANIATAENDLTAAQQELADLEASGTATQSQLNAAEQRVTDAEAALATAEQRLTVAEGAIAGLQQQVVQIAASVSDETTARVNADGALAQRLTTAESVVAGNSSSVTQIQQSINGIESRWGVAVNSNGQVLGTVQLSGGQNGSDFVVIANRFLVAQPDGATPTEVFAVGQINGQAAVGIKGALLIDGSVLARHIAAGEIDAAKLNVDSLSAIAANIGVVVAGKLQDDADNPEYEFDVQNGRMRRTDGTMDIDLKNKRLRIVS